MVVGPELRGPKHSRNGYPRESHRDIKIYGAKENILRRLQERSWKVNTFDDAVFPAGQSERGHP